MPRVITFGEIMLRLKSPALERFFQSPALEATFGGGEANVAVSLANYGMDAAFVTLLPDNDIGRACLRTVRGYGVDVSFALPNTMEDVDTAQVECVLTQAELDALVRELEELCQKFPDRV